MRSVPVALGAAGDPRFTLEAGRPRVIGRRWLIVLALAALLGTLVPAAQVRAASADTVRAWNQYAVEALANAPGAATPGAGLTPPVTVIHLAMVQTAVYDAVNAIVGGRQPYLDGLPDAPSTASIDAAVATAAHGVLTFPGLLQPAMPAGVVDRLDDLYHDFMDTLADDGAKAAGIAIGAAAAAEMIENRTGDGRYSSYAFSQGTGPGEWRPTTPGVSDPFAWVALVTPFSLKSSSQLRTEGPLDMASPEYAAEFNEVKAIGSATSATRTAAQTALAMYYTESPAVLFNRTFRILAQDRGLGAAKTARLFAALNMAAADAIISCWDDKEYWSFWRPVTAIRLADTDGNAATMADPAWTPLGGNPPYPDHPSGYNCFTGAVVHTAKAFFGTDKVSFKVRNAAGVERSYKRFTDVARDTIDARIYLGIHFRTPDVQGVWIGKKSAQWVAKHEFTRIK